MLEARWWSKVHGVRPWEMDQIPLEYADWWPRIEQAEQIANERASKKPPEPKQQRRRGGV